jgi:hypothetical protein
MFLLLLGVELNGLTALLIVPFPASRVRLVVWRLRPFRLLPLGLPFGTLRRGRLLASRVGHLAGSFERNRLMPADAY